MATGPGPGSHLIGGAHVRLTIDDRSFLRGLQNANLRLQQFATAANQAIRNSGFGRMAQDIRNVAAQVALLGRNVDAVTARFRAMNRVIQSTTINAQALARAVNSIGATNISAVGTMFSRIFGRVGTGVGNVFRGLGAGLSSVARGFGSGLQSAFTGLGTATRGLGIGLGAVARGFGSLLSQTIRASGSVLTGIVRIFTGQFRNLLSFRLPGLGNLAFLGTLAGGVGAAFSLVYITNQIVKMEHELTRLRRTTGASAQEIQAIAASFNNMGTTLAGVDLNQIIELATMGARLGVPREQLNLFTRDLAKVAAVLEDITIDEATQRFSGLIDVFQLAYTDTIRLASSLNALDIASNASGRDILDIAGRMSGAASTIGLTVQQTLALATAMRQARVPIETAGTAMSQILGRMTSKDMPAFARVAGMGGAAFRNLLQRDALQALVAVEQGLGRLGGIERFRALDELHLDGQRVRLVMLQLVPVLGRLNQYLGIANDEWTSTNSIMQGFRMQAETATAMFKRMWNNVQLLAVSLGTFLLPVLKGFADGIGNLSADIRAFITGNGEKLQAWGKSIGQVIENLGAVTRVDWRRVFGMVNDAGGQFWRVFLDNAKVAAINTGIVLIRVLSDVGTYFIRDLIPRIMNALFEAGRAFYVQLAKWMPDFLFIGGPTKQEVIKNLQGLQPPMQPQGMQGLFDPKNLFGGLQPMPGLAAGPDIKGIFRFINNQFLAGGAQQRQEKNQREAAGALGDLMVRFLGGLRGKGGAQDKALGRLIGMANLEDQAGVGGVGGGGGGLGVGGEGVIPNGAAMGMAGAMGGPGVAGGPPLDLMGLNRMRLGLMAAGMGGVFDQAGMRHAELLAWRQRMAARLPGAANPWAAVRRNLAAQRQAMFLAVGGGRVLAGRAARRDAIRRLEAMRRGRMDARIGAPDLVRDRFRNWQRNAGLIAGGWGPDFQFNPMFNQRPGVMDMLGAMRPGPPRLPPQMVGAPAWTETVVGGITETLNRGFDRIARAIGIPQFGD